MSNKRFQTYFGVAVPPWKQESYNTGATTIRFVLTGAVISKKNNEQAIAIRKYARDFLKEQAKKVPADKAGYISLVDAQKAIGMVYAKMRGNAQYIKFLAMVKPVLAPQMSYWIERLQHKGLMFPLPSKASISIRLYIKDQYRRDTVNAMQTIHDMLKDCGILFDDDDKHLNPVTGASARYYEELLSNITVISISLDLNNHACNANK